MPRIKFPKIPNLPGVPSLNRISSGVNFPKFFMGILTGIGWGLLKSEPNWGIFDSSGKKLGDSSSGGLFKKIKGLLGESSLSTLSFEVKKETKISDFPIEEGGFASYNKVQMPNSPVITLIFSGSEAERMSFINDIDYACKSTELFSIITPEATYINHSIESFNYSKSNSGGGGWLQVEIFLKEIRQVAVAYSSANIVNSSIDKPKDIGATGQVDIGKVQTKQVEQSTLLNLTNKIKGLK